jgi:transcriptional regulator with XRE-family HTH domain
MDEKRICQNIMKLRKARNMSMRRLAELTGLTKGYISRIEKADKAPPFSTLSKISNALNASLFKDLLSPDPEEQNSEPDNLCIVRKNEREKILSNRLRGHHYEALAQRRIGKNMEPFLIEPGFDEPVLFSHEGEEFLFGMEGTQEFVYGNRKYILHEGDSVYFDSVTPHGGRSLGEKKAKVLAVMYSYKRIEPRHLVESDPRKRKRSTRTGRAPV